MYAIRSYYGLFEHAAHLERGFEADPARGRRLSLGQAVNHVLVDEQGKVGIAPRGVQEVVPALAEHVPVAALGDHGELRVRGLNGRRRGQGAPVKPVEKAGVHVLGHLRRLADSGNHYDLFPLEAQFLERREEAPPDGKVAAARAPGYVPFFRKIEFVRHMLRNNFV